MGRLQAAPRGELATRDQTLSISVPRAVAVVVQLNLALVTLASRGRRTNPSRCVRMSRLAWTGSFFGQKNWQGPPV